MNHREFQGEKRKTSKEVTVIILLGHGSDNQRMIPIARRRIRRRELPPQNPNLEYPNFSKTPGIWFLGNHWTVPDTKGTMSWILDMQCPWIHASEIFHFFKKEKGKRKRLKFPRKMNRKNEWAEKFSEIYFIYIDLGNEKWKSTTKTTSTSIYLLYKRWQGKGQKMGNGFILNVLLHYDLLLVFT